MFEKHVAAHTFYHRVCLYRSVLKFNIAHKMYTDFVLFTVV